jgi:hypothetical protein
MKKILIGLLIVSTSTQAEDKFLKYQYNKDVEVVISNISCPFNYMKDKYPLAVVANRSDGDHLFGCYTHKNEDIIIQWDGGDKTILPSNYFLNSK